MHLLTSSTVNSNIKLYKLIKKNKSELVGIKSPDKFKFKTASDQM